jgi:hypothetical protein
LKQGAAPKPRPLYGLNRLSEHPDAPVCITEGEKACEAAQKLLPDYVCVTSSGGASAAEATDWSPLSGRKVSIWADNDEPGRKYANLLAKKILSDISPCIQLLDIDALDLPPKGDAADWPLDVPLPNPLPLCLQIDRDEKGAAIWTHFGKTEILPTRSGRGNSITQKNGSKPAELPPLPEGYTAKELCDSDFPEPSYIIPSLLPEGLGILAERPKIGKSWFCLGLGVAVAVEGYVLGNIQVHKGDVLYCALEDSPRRLKKRLTAILGGAPAPENLYIVTSWPRTDQGGLALLLEWIKTHPDTRLIIIDTLARIMPAQGARSSENLYARDYGLIGSLKAVADEHNIAILLIHHLRKAISDDPVDGISGTTGISGAADTLLLLDRTRGKSDATLTATGRDIEEVKLALRFDPTIMSWVNLGPASDVVTTNEQNQVLQALEKLGGSARRKEIAQQLGKDPNLVGKLLQKLVKAGVIQQDAYGPYTLSSNTPSIIPTVHTVPTIPSAPQIPLSPSSGTNDGSGNGVTGEHSPFFQGTERICGEVGMVGTTFQEERDPPDASFEGDPTFEDDDEEVAIF